MNKNMEIIEKQIRYLESLRHKNLKDLNAKERITLKAINSLNNVGGVNWYSPKGRKVDMGIISLVMGSAKKHVAEEKVGKFRISTVWLGLDHGQQRFFDKGKTKPVIFETMIFGEVHEEDPFSEYLERYSTIEEAEEGHISAVEKVKDYLKLG